MEKAVKTEVVYDRFQICEVVKRLTGRTVSEDDSFYKWLDACLTKLKPLYSTRDLKKFLFVAFYLYIKRSFQLAKQELHLDLNQNKLLYSESITIEQFLEQNSTIQIAQVKRQILINNRMRSQFQHLQVLEVCSA